MTEQSALDRVLNDKDCPEVWLDYLLAKSQNIKAEITDSVCTVFMPARESAWQVFDYNFIMPLAEKAGVEIIPPQKLITTRNNRAKNYVVKIGHHKVINKSLLDTLKRVLIKAHHE